MCMYWAQAAAVGDEEVSLPGEPFRVQHTGVLLLDLPPAAHCHHLSAHVQIITCQVPPDHAAHAGSQNEVISLPN
jgi:hypothetical protein